MLGVNFYTPAYVSAQPGTPASPENPGTEGIAFRPPVGPITDIGWQIEPAALTKLLDRMHHDYGRPDADHRERRRVPGRPVEPTARSTTPTASTTSTATCGPAWTPFPTASTFGDTSRGR